MLLGTVEEADPEEEQRDEGIEGIEGIEGEVADVVEENIEIADVLEDSDVESLSDKSTVDTTEAPPVEPEPEPESKPEPEPESKPEQEVSDNEAAAAAAVQVSTRRAPEHVPYLLIGAGTASFAAYRAIKARDPLAKILIIGDEEHLPYMRTPLSKELWFMTDKKAVEELRFKQWNGRERSLHFEPQSFYLPLEEFDESSKGGISLLLGERVTRVDAGSRTVFLSDGTEIHYDKCLIATG